MLFSKFIFLQFKNYNVANNRTRANAKHLVRLPSRLPRNVGNESQCQLHINKAGHPQFKSATPQYCRQPNRLWSSGLRKSCGTAIANLQNLTSAIPQLSAVSCQFRYFLVPFTQLRMVLKIYQKYFKNCLFLWKPKICLKGRVARDFLPPFLFLEPRLDSTAINMLEIVEMKLSICDLKLRTSEKIAIAELRL